MFNSLMGLLLGLPQIAGLGMTTSPLDNQFKKTMIGEIFNNFFRGGLDIQ
jgi:hypothetical protein